MTVTARAVAEPRVTGSALGDVARLVRRHALGWWLAANAVGLLLAVELIWPAVGDALAPWTYGRWMPLHLNWQLYGWCALPLVGALLHACLEPRHPHARLHVHAVLGAWSLALVLGGWSWLQGLNSGKIFLDWHGWARPLLPAAMVGLWTVLAAHLWWRWQTRREFNRLAVGLVLGLMLVPTLLYWSEGRDVYPAVNPHSGGATGTSLLGSTLGVVVIFLLLPVLLRVERRSADQRRTRARVTAGAAVVSLLAFLLLDHGAASHHAAGQIAGLAVLLVWWPLVRWHWSGWAWSEGARRWRRAAEVWWAVLLSSGWFMFLPGISERLKFTNALVGHAHLAMAGLVTSVNLVVLNELNPTRPLQRGFVWWQAGCAVHVGVLLVAGWFERDRAGDWFGGADWTQAVYLIRLVAGAAMMVGALQTWREVRAA